MSIQFITLTKDNIDQEHICCAISDKKGENCVASKKAWLKERFKDGMVFTKLNERGKVFIQYTPGEYAFAPITANTYMYIDCFWVSGKFKGQGYANKLLDECIADAKAKGKIGIAALASDKNRTFLSDPGYLKHKGFRTADCANPYFELLYLPFEDNAPKPVFNTCAKNGQITEPGIVLFYSNGCPHTDKYVKIVEQAADEAGILLKVHKIETLEQAKNSPTPFTVYSIYKDGNFITNEILTEKKFLKLFAEVK